jgi:hypothetical protein
MSDCVGMSEQQIPPLRYGMTNKGDEGGLA